MYNPDVHNFIKDLIIKAAPVAIFLINGVKLCGIITSCDEPRTALILEREGKRQMIFFRAISTIMPAHSTEEKVRNNERV